MIHRKKNDLLYNDATYMSVSQLLAMRIHPYSETGRKQAQDPPGSLHTHISSVERISFKGRGPR